MAQPFYITTPIYYVNDIPHIGHAYTTLACDTLARYKRLAGDDVYFLTGTDEHGQKVEKAAEQKGLAPQDFVDQVSQSFRDLIPAINATPDDFIRTTEIRHKQAVQHLWDELVKQGAIYLGEYSGWYAVRDEAFYGEGELVNGKAPTGADVEWVTESSYFFRLSAFQDRLLELYHQNPGFIAPQSRRNEVMRFVEGGLHDLSISRTSFKWGVTVPNDPKHVVYVWLDALTNYITALEYPDQGGNFGKYWPHAIHVVGKDILRFHAVYWPAFLMAANLPLPKQIFAHGWWTNEGEKISKSLGNTIDPIELVQTFGADAVRYFLLREVSFGQDGDFSRQQLINRYNSDLANAYGNLVQRVLSFIHKSCDGVVPKPQDLQESDQDLLNACMITTQLETDMEALAFHKYADHAWQIIAHANRYMDEQKPWGLKTTDVPRMHTILYALADTIRQIALLTQPLLPVASAAILDQLAIPLDQRKLVGNPLKPGTPLPEPKGVFPRYVP
ncbi:methionine--tRNA ligase [Candidatus Finniella inopinata]|uniref:Methionine--tRNA ligase n=1 Tax=Candidatus Finniella inopinata TaxID=1696036 RepID=A0A4V2E009_9PROT|nr:methionine--tRNA ligase [Candidatus Finniella inopinata]RZI46917.1 methionine--tRNA ligase [Candidatus Finniella inopinata]